ncbi:MAG: hypothetical protein IT258_22600 [Saprospiraceae bacterium]|nr:hypothetical protein [Saprospiraceae bacterium]
MLIRSFLIAFLLGSCLSAHSQTLIAEFPTNYRKAKISDLLMAYTEKGNTGLCYSTEQNLVVRIMDTEGKLVYQKEGKDEGGVLTPVGTLDLGDAFQFIYYNEDYYKFTIVNAHKTDSTKVALTDLNPFNDKDKYLTSLISDNDFYTLAWNKKAHQLRFGRYDKTTGQFNMKEKGFSDDLAKTLSKAEIAPISDATIPEPGLAASKYKIYRRSENQIALTVEGNNYEKCQTELVLFDCESGNIGIFSLGASTPGSIAFVSNSYIHDGKIALMKSEVGVFNLEIIDLETLKKVQEYKYIGNTPINIMSSQLYSEVDGETVSNDYKVLTKDRPQKVMAQLSRGTPFLYFEPTNSGQTIFTIGNVTEANGGGMIMTGGMPGSTISTPYGTIRSPGTPGTFRSYGNSFSRSKYFYALMEPSTFKHTEGLALEQTFLSFKVRDFVKRRITNKSGGLFAVEPEYQILKLPNPQEALLVSYVKSDGLIKLHKISTTASN